MLFHTPQTKQQSKQWFKKNKLGQIKVEVQASNTKQMLLTFFELKGLIHTNSMPREQTINATYIRKALGKFMKIFRQKRFIMASEDWFLHWCNVATHSATILQIFLFANYMQVIAHSPDVSYLMSAYFFLLSKVKSELASISMAQDAFKSTWEGTINILTKSGFLTDFQ